MRRRQVRFAPLAAGFALLFLGACGRGDASKAQQAPPAVPVVTAKVTQKTVPEEVRGIGTVVPYATVAVKARVDGQITEVGFAEGQPVRRESLLFLLDQRGFEAQLRQAEAALGRSQALLANSVAQDRRYADLLNQNFISKEYYAQVRTNLETAQAAVRADQAAVENVRVQLSYTRIVSPIDGVAGKLLLQRGNLVKANDTNPLVVVNQVTPIFVEFSVPDAHLAAIRKRAAEDTPLAVSVTPQAGGATVSGRLSFVDNNVDAATGTIRLKATYENKDRSLWPGQFVQVALRLGELRNALVVPSQAVQRGPDGLYVFVVKSDQTAEQRAVKVSRSVEADSIIATGLALDEVVVIDGQSRLAPGAKVKVADAKVAAALAKAADDKEAVSK